MAHAERQRLLLSFQAIGRDGAVVELPGAELAADGTMRLSVDVDLLGEPEPATLWFVM